MFARVALLLLFGLAPVVFGAGAVRAFTFGPDDHFVYAIPGAGTDYVALSITGSHTDTGPFGEYGFSQATADIASGTLHSYATADNGGGAGAVSALSVPVTISGPVRTGIATFLMRVHGTWQVGTYTFSGITTEGYAQFEGLLYDWNNGAVPVVDHERNFGSGLACGYDGVSCVTRSGLISETLRLDVPFDLDVNSLVQLTGYLYATALYQATMDLSHTATFSITVPSGDSYSTILGSGGTAISEPATLTVFGSGVLGFLLLARRRPRSGAIVLGAMLTGLAGCAVPPAAPPPGTQLSAAGLRATLVGNTGYGTSSDGNHWTGYNAPDGSAKTKYAWGIDSGVWRITDDGHWCTRWNHIRVNREWCQTVFQEGDTVRFVHDGSVSSTAQLKSGNPENL